VRIVVHDYSGHPGQAQLSRALARRGHSVVHQHCPSYATGKGALERTPEDPDTLAFEPCPLPGRFDRYSTVRRVRQEVSYGRLAGRRIAAQRPDVAVLSNVPLVAHALVALRLRRRRIPTVFWHQDIYSAAIAAAATKRLPRAGRAVGVVADRVERAVARSSAAVVAISPVFLGKLGAWGVAHKTTVVPNWAPIEELPVRDRDNAWSRQMGLTGRPVVLYAGTLGLKHDPGILAHVAAELRDAEPDARVVVVSEGKGREWLEAWKRDQQADNLVLLDYQDYERLPDVLASADVLVALLEPDASKYSVPSKVLTYMCARRAILGVMPADNSVAEVLLSNGAGVVVEPSERDEVTRWTAKLLADRTRRDDLAGAGRAYAEREFSPVRAAERFEAIAAACLGAGPGWAR
jgi:glycosyltransferase involved in cell wall biosynthesis